MRANNGIPIFLDLAVNLPLGVANCSIPICIMQLWWGRLELLTIGTDGDVVVTIETSFDQINWVAWNECSKIKLTDNLTHIRMYELDGLWYRICINATDTLNTNTEGTINAKLFIKELK